MKRRFPASSAPSLRHQLEAGGLYGAGAAAGAVGALAWAWGPAAYKEYYESGPATPWSQLRTGP